MIKICIFATSITQSHFVLFLSAGEIRRFVYETPVDITEKLVARIAPAAMIISGIPGFFFKRRVTITKSLYD